MNEYFAFDCGDGRVVDTLLISGEDIRDEKEALLNRVNRTIRKWFQRPDSELDRFSKKLEDASYRNYSPRSGNLQHQYIATLPSEQRYFAIFSEILISFDRLTTENECQRVLAEHNLSITRSVWPERRLYVATPDQPQSLQRLQSTCKILEDVHKAEFATLHIAGDLRREGIALHGADHWHLRQRTGVSADRAWDLLESVSTTTITVAVLDDGVDIYHDDLKERIDIMNARDFSFDPSDDRHYDSSPKIFSVRDRFRLADNDIHGTPCAALISAFADPPQSGGSSTDHGVYGVAPNSKVLPIRIINAGTGLVPAENLLRAIKYAAEKADILSCSWSAGPEYIKPLRWILSKLSSGDPTFKRRLLGVPCFFAAGTRTPVNRGVEFPAKLSRSKGFESVISVNAFTEGGGLAGYCCTGPEIMVCAPGGAAPNSGDWPFKTSDVLPIPRGLFDTNKASGFTPPGSRGDEQGKRTDKMHGTSAAAAIAAGVGALILSAYSELPLASLRKILEECSDADNAGYNTSFGYGKINAARAVQAALDLKASDARQESLIS